jgi:hypothetical protein
MSLPYANTDYGGPGIPDYSGAEAESALTVNAAGDLTWKRLIPDTSAAAVNDSLTHIGDGVVNWRSPSLNLFNYISNATPALIGQNISGASANDQLSAVDISNDGTRIVVGASQGTGNGYVQVYDRQISLNGVYGGYVWTQLGSDLAAGTDDMFGFSVAIAKNAKDRIVIGAPHQSQSSVSSAGYVHVYHYNNGNWVSNTFQVRTANGSRNGIAVAISDDGLVMAFASVANDLTLGGQVKVIRWPDLASLVGSNYTEQTLTYVNRGATEPDRFGHDLQLSSDGSRLVVSTPGLIVNGQTFGAVYVYDYITTGGVSQYSEIQYIAGPAANNGAGESVTLSGDGTRLAIGVAFQDNSGDRGVVYIYHYDVNSSSFQYITFVRGYNLEYLGLTKGGLALNQNGHRLVIGSTDYENTGTNNRGRVLVYEYNTQTATWNQFTQIIDEEETDRRFGSDTSMTRDGSFIITSAINDDNIHGVNAGLVKVYGLPAALTSGSLYYSSDNIIRIIP